MAEAPVASVSGVQALRWFDIKLQGRGSHAGTTPMRFRMDPMGVFARFVVAAEEIAHQFDGLATIGRVGSDAPQSTNCIIDDVAFALDIRHHEDSKIEAMEVALREKLSSLAQSAQGVDVVRFDQIANNAYVKFDPLAVSCIQDACSAYPKHSIVSGAGHDS